MRHDARSPSVVCLYCEGGDRPTSSESIVCSCTNTQMHYEGVQQPERRQSFIIYRRKQCLLSPFFNSRSGFLYGELDALEQLWTYIEDVCALHTWGWALPLPAVACPTEGGGGGVTRTGIGGIHSTDCETSRSILIGMLAKREWSSAGDAAPFLLILPSATIGGLHLRLHLSDVFFGNGPPVTACTRRRVQSTQDFCPKMRQWPAEVVAKVLVKQRH